MFMAYHIEKSNGAEALKECIKNGPAYFIKQYIEIQAKDGRLPALCEELTEFINTR